MPVPEKKETRMRNRGALNLHLVQELDGESMKLNPNPMPILLGILMLTLISVSACSRSTKRPEASSTAQRYELKGKVVSAEKGNHTVTIDHEAITGYMEAMTMPFDL